MASNYIKRLQEDGSVKAAELETLYSGLTALCVYLSSDKFANDPTVQVRDVQTRIREICQEAMSVGMRAV
jgi:hypothetical protein